MMVEGASGLGSYTTVSIQTHANGAASFEFVGEDGSRAWVTHNADSGNRTVTINSGQEVAGEPRTVIYELDRDSRRVGQERYFDAAGTPVNERGEVQASPAAPALAPAPAQAPAPQEPIPQIITHEQRVTRTPGGMSFAEAHQRRDEPEQTSPGSLQPVGKLDASHLDKGSKLYRMHQANEQDLMRSLGVAQAQDKERFKNEPAPGRQQPSVERTQERAPEQAPRRLLEETPVQKQAARPAAAAEAMHSPTTHASVAAPVHSNPQPAAADLAAAQAELAEMREREARMEEQRRQEGLERRDERNRREETTRVAQSHGTRQHLKAAVADTRPLLRDFSDPSHPQNALYNTIKGALPADTSPRWLAQATATCYMSNIKKHDDLGDIHGINGTVVFMTNSLFSRTAFVETTQPLLTIQQTMQEVQQYDQQQAHMMSEIGAQNAAQADPQQGAVLGGP